MKYNRYLVFGGDRYYPNGGMRDFAGSFETQDVAENYAKSKEFDWWHIWDKEEERIILRT